MKYTFKLKEPNSKKETLILFTCFFKEENKKFVYSTQQNINPKYWDKKEKFLFCKGDYKPPFAESIKIQLNKYSGLFVENEAKYSAMNEPFTSKILRKLLDEKFERAITGKNKFFEAYDEFTTDKIRGKEWSEATIKRYQNIKNILKKFEISKKCELSFSYIDEEFHREFTCFCLDELNHINNTYSRNLGLLKTFMFWALKKKYTFNDAFVEFKKLERVPTNQIALTIEDLNKLMEFKFKTDSLERVRDVFVFQCVTGFRFGDLSFIERCNVSEDFFLLKEQKDPNKPPREIPFTSISKYILTKYNFKLPLITNQNQNDYIKELFKAMEYIDKVQKISIKGRDIIREEMFYYERISTHTARRSFITMMKRQGKSEKLIASFTGHKDMRTLNQYYQVSEPERKEALDEVFDVKIPLKIA